MVLGVPIPCQSLEEASLLAIVKSLSGHLVEAPQIGNPSVEDLIFQLTSKLSLPASLSSKVRVYLTRLDMQLSLWADCHRDCISDFSIRQTLKRVQWTKHGTINGHETTQVFVRDPNRDPNDRFKLACVYCLENDIHVLCHIFHPELEDTMYLNPWIIYWGDHFRDLIPNVDYLLTGRICGCGSQTCLHMFGQLCINGHEGAAIFLKERLGLSVEEMKREIKSTLQLLALDFRSFHTNYLVTKVIQLLEVYGLDSAIEGGLVKMFALPILEHFFNWPSQSMFSAILPKLCHLLEPRVCFLLLQHMAEQSKEEFPRWFAIFWPQIATQTKQCMIRFLAMGPFGTLLWDLFFLNQESLVRMALADATYEQRESLFFCKNGQKICKYLITMGRWEALDMFACRCMTDGDASAMERIRNILRLRQGYDTLDRLLSLQVSFIKGRNRQ